MKRPDFIICGAGRSGTTSLFEYLKQHPNICMSSVKEITYFGKYYHNGEDFYLKFFKHCNPRNIIGEGSQNEMIYPDSPKRMYKFNSEFKLIFVLRNPVERVISDYKYWISRKGETRTLFKILEENSIFYKNHLFIEKSLYYKHINRFLDYFPKDQCHFIIFDDYVSDTKKELKKCFKFLQVNPDFEINLDVQKNPSIPPINVELQRYISRLNRRINLENSKLENSILGGMCALLGLINHASSKKRFPIISSEEKKFLLDKYFIDDIRNTEKLIKRNLFHWME